MSSNSVLIIEDDQVDQMAFTRIIGKSNPSVKITIAENIAEAKEQLAHNKFYWVISDYNLPDGTINDILHFSKDNPMICVTGETDESRVQFLLQKGCKHFFIKDQHLNYLGEIAQLMQSTPPAPTKKSKHPPTSFTLNALQQQFGDDKKIIQEILDIFTNEGAKDLSSLRNAIKTKDTDLTYHLAHRIKSGYRVLGIPVAIELLGKIETAAQIAAPVWRDLLLEVDLVDQEYQKARQAIPQLLQKLCADA